ncbi:MAG: hypothetical protein OSB23_07910 [Porticoccaceae bacterium]|jgi:hypothetical protein|nr:hypothetical protein [Porticoccaceae bacterium]|tara:strand:- start:1745 stop:2080 length:336 start_codon:yes stop_codon:yes gene_type:complete
MTNINQNKLTEDFTYLEDSTSVKDTFRLANARNKALRGQRSSSNTWSWLVLGSSCAALAIIMLTPLSIETYPLTDTTLAINQPETFATLASIEQDENLAFYYWLDIYDEYE